ncbi:MAG: nucleotidyltransferase domain-containing protein [Nitrososphaeria archaeon]|nr:nucleotidyltransferase domain-containing protein [Nitrososphaeria archaeon]
MFNTPYDEEIRIFCKNVLEKISLRSIILYGSMATRRFGVGSDVDIIVISDHLPENFLDRLNLLFKLNHTTAPIEPLGYKPNEFLKMIRKRHPTALYAVSEGIPLYDDGFFDIAKKVFEEIRYQFDIIKIEHGWEARTITSKIVYTLSPSS